MIQELISIIEKVKEKITPGSDMVWTGYDTAKQLHEELDNHIQQLQKGDRSALEALYTYFLPTATFQEHSISNDWPDEYLKLAEAFDCLYEKLKQNSA